MTASGVDGEKKTAVQLADHADEAEEWKEESWNLKETTGTCVVVMICNGRRTDLLDLTEEGAENLKHVDVIALNRNELTCLPASFARLSLSLRGLQFDFNSFRSFKYAWLASFRRLEFIDLNRNMLTELPRCFSEIYSLRDIYCNHNYISVVPRWLLNMPRLEGIYLGNNRIRSLPLFLSRMLAESGFGGRLTELVLFDNPCMWGRGQNNERCCSFVREELAADKARMMAFAEYVFYPKWIEEGKFETVSRNSAFDKNLVRFVWTYLSNAVSFKDRVEEGG